MALEVLLELLAIVVLLPTTVLLIQVVAALLPQREAKISGRRSKLVVLIPAHNEASVLADTIAAVRPQLLSGDRIVVVADNCTDDTANVARAAATEVIERNQPDRRGKGYALAFGVQHLEADPPDVVIILDADCLISKQSLDFLARRCGESQRPVQALDVMRCAGGDSVGMRVAEFAWLVKNVVRPLGFRRLGLPCQLMGTGMAFPWPLLRQLPISTESLAEDLQLGVDAARAGRAPCFCPQVKVESWFSENPAAIAQQRTRWEHGHLRGIFSTGPRLIWEALISGNWPLLALAIDMCIPPLAVLALLTASVCVGSFVVYVFEGQLGAFALAMIAAGGLFAAVGLAWARFGREVISLRELAYAPIYAVVKIPLYVTFVIRRQTEWVRTRRLGD